MPIYSINNPNTNRINIDTIIRQSNCTFEPCIDQFICKNLNTICGCINYSKSFSDLWNDIQDWISSQNYTCNNNPITCGEWKSSDQRDCCSSPCYIIWHHVMNHLGYTQDVIDTKSPQELDASCSGTLTISPSFFPLSSGNLYSFGNVSYDDFFFKPILDTNHNANNETPLFNSLMGEGASDIDPSLGSGNILNYYSPVGFANLSSGNIIVPPSSLSLDQDEQNLILTLFNSGSFAPYSGVLHYKDVNNCIDCYGALYKLSTPDVYGRDEWPSFMSGTLINNISGTLENNTQFLFSTSSKLNVTECINTTFPGTSSVSPYGILTNQLTASNLSINTIFSDYGYKPYFEFDVAYKYEISWDGTTYYPFTNKWNVTYSPQSGSSIFSFSGSATNFYDNNISQPINAHLSSDTFNSFGNDVGTYIYIQWNNSGVLIGNNDSFSDILLSGINNTRSEPTISITSSGTGIGCSFTPVLQQFTETNNQPYWSISGVIVSGSGSGYSNNENLFISVVSGDVVDISGVLKLQTSSSGVIAPEISGTINTGFISPALLLISTEEYQNEPKRFRINDIIVSNSGSGYNDGIYDIEFDISETSIQEIPATGIVITERVVPNFSHSIVTQSGLNAQISVSPKLIRNSNGQKAWIFDYFDCDSMSSNIQIINGGSGYQPTDYLEINIESSGIIDTNFSREFVINQYQTKQWRIPLGVDGNGTIVDINDSNIFSTEAFYKPTGRIEMAILTGSLSSGLLQSCEYSNLNNDPSLNGGSFYKQISSSVPTGVLIENVGKYYHPNSGIVRPVSGPNISNIRMDIWHPGPCGISEELKDDTGLGVPWSGYYYGNLVQNRYQKFWLANIEHENNNIDPCACCIPINMVFGVVKYEGCESYRKSINYAYEIPLKQWEIDLEFCNGLSSTYNKIYSRECDYIDNGRINCGIASFAPPADEINDYYYDSFNTCHYPTPRNVNRSHINIPSTGVYTLQNAVIDCVDVRQIVPPGTPINCNLKDNTISPWASGNIICPNSSPSPSPN